MLLHNKVLLLEYLKCCYMNVSFRTNYALINIKAMLNLIYSLPKKKLKHWIFCMCNNSWWLVHFYKNNFLPFYIIRLNWMDNYFIEFYFLSKKFYGRNSRKIDEHIWAYKRKKQEKNKCKNQQHHCIKTIPAHPTYWIWYTCRMHLCIIIV